MGGARWGCYKSEEESDSAGEGMAGASAPFAHRGSSLREVFLEEPLLQRMEANSKPAWPLSSHVTLEPPLAVTGRSLCNLKAIVRRAEKLGEWGL